MELQIEKLVYGGDGLARLEQQDGKRKTVFVPLVLPGEKVEASIVEDRPGFARARLDRVLDPSPHRTSPPCPYFGECGGCHYQHATYEEQLKQKQQILRETVERIAKLQLPEIVVHASPPLHYRNRTRLKLAGREAGQNFVVGYHKFGSHDLLPVRECPISSPLINRAIQAVWQLGVDYELPQGLIEIEFFANDTDAELLLEFLVEPNADRSRLAAFADELQSTLKQVVGVAAIPHRHRADEVVAAPELDGAPAETAISLSGRSYLDYRVREFSYRVSAGSFFQTNRYLTSTLMDLACAGAQGNTAIDLYAGAGLFTLPLAKSFERVIAVESAPSSFGDLKSNAPRNAKPVQATTEAFLQRSSQKPDF
ncbi:MAG: 23S rRNA (uracil(1939)-C(5))-methyltransferase RlmD, partial [Terriglobales bacterium]